MEQRPSDSTTRGFPPESLVSYPTHRSTAVIDLGHGIKLELLLIPPGEFMRGSPESDYDPAKREEPSEYQQRQWNAGAWDIQDYNSCNNPDEIERPQHLVRITKPFYLGKYPITQEQWKAVTGENPSLWTRSDKLPVDGASWHDCVALLEKLNSANRVGVGGNFVLPSQWLSWHDCLAFIGKLDAQLVEVRGKFVLPTEAVGIRMSRKHESVLLWRSLVGVAWICVVRLEREP